MLSLLLFVPLSVVAQNRGRGVEVSHQNILSDNSDSVDSGVVKLLVEMGMEDVKAITKGDNTYICYEDNIYRGNYRGIAQTVKSLREIVPTQTINLLLLSDGIAQISIVVPENFEQLEVSYSTTKIAEQLKGKESHNRRFGKTDIVLYPELFLENSWLDRLYGYAVNLSPAVEVSLWKGAEFTGQVVLPLKTNMVDEHQYIRPGFITLRQSFRLPKNIMGDITVGNFDTNRAGLNLNLCYYSLNNRLSFGVNGALTGSSTFNKGEWTLSQWRRFSGSFWGGYYIPRYNMETKISVGRMIYGDSGVRVDMARHFGEVAVGLYAHYYGGDPNGGFSFTVPMPSKRRWARKPIRVTIPEEFSRVYRAQSSRDLLLGYSFTTRPDESWNLNFYNPIYIRNRVVGLLRELLKIE
ncbi:MAG: YjbH domain-containing protein [Rikenellaceae bacterium]